MNKGVIIMAGIFSTILGLFGCSRKPEAYEVAEIYDGLRKQLFSFDPTTIGISGSDTKNQIYAIVMDTGYPEAVVTLVAVSDGSVSLYFSNGGGLIGMGGHEGPRKVLKEYMELAPAYLEKCEKVSEYPLPVQGETKFYILTNKGIFSAYGKESDMGNNRHELSPLFHKAHELITAIRIVDEKLKAK